VYEFPFYGGDPYYPVPRPENHEIYRQSKELADATPNIHFVGRLATYKYYNMDQVTAQALTLFDELMGVRAKETKETPGVSGTPAPGETNGTNGKVAVQPAVVA
ncbi:MAG: UDP-galactopyranose mutase, partial [Chloroflexota bacterium]